MAFCISFRSRNISDERVTSGFPYGIIIKYTSRAGAVQTDMKLEIGKQSSINAILMMGIFTFLFLGVEYYFVKLIALMVDGNSTVSAQNYALGISALGFLLYPLFHRCLKKPIRQICTLLLAMAAVFCIFLMERRFSYALVLFPGMAAFLILGLFGSADVPPLHVYAGNESLSGPPSGNRLCPEHSAAICDQQSDPFDFRGGAGLFAFFAGACGAFAENGAGG